LPEIQRESDLLKRQKKEREKRGRRREREKKRKTKHEKLFLARYVRSCVKLKVMHGVGVGHDWVKPWVGAAHR
jgi:hypothetical protein